MKKMFFLTILITLALTLTSQSFALYNIMDGYAAEVLLNKPDITSNIHFIKNADNVSVSEGSVTYRSNFDERIAVILTEETLRDTLQSMSVRLQLPVKENVTPNVYSVVGFRNVTLDDLGEDFLKSLGYDVNIVGMGAGDERPVDERPVDEPVVGDPIERPVNDLPVMDGKTDNGDAPDVPPDEQTVIMPNPDADEKPYIISRTLSILLNKRNVAWSIVQYETVDGNNVEFILNIADAETISDEVKGDFQQMLQFYGFDRNALDQLDENINIGMSVDIVPDMELDRDEFDIHSAMKAELEWLKAYGIIMGITDQDVAGISSATKIGLAGWNSRIAYSDGSWVPYYETEDPYLIRTFTEDAEVATGTVDVPDGWVILPTASVKPDGKAATKWGKIKTVF